LTGELSAEHSTTDWGDEKIIMVNFNIRTKKNSLLIKNHKLYWNGAENGHKRKLMLK
jgi:hypothetical protein